MICLRVLSQVNKKQEGTRTTTRDTATDKEREENRAPRGGWIILCVSAFGYFNHAGYLLEMSYCQHLDSVLKNLSNRFMFEPSSPSVIIVPIPTVVKGG